MKTDILGVAAIKKQRRLMNIFLQGNMSNNTLENALGNSTLT